tara:strand:+ start:10276 stop:10674 length:399 start_codon:yes stop_codon:yes gene_type:complete
MPGLDLLSEDGHDAIGVLLEEGLAKVGGVDGLEDLRTERTDVVEVYVWLSVSRTDPPNAVFIHISRVWTALGCIALEANFWPANLGARAIARKSGILLLERGCKWGNTIADESMVFLHKSEAHARARNVELE